MQSNKLYKAKIDWVKTDKYGKQFTKIKIDNREVFVHINKFQPKVSSLNVGDEICFQIEEDISGLSAKDIKIVSKGTKPVASPNDKSSSSIQEGISPYDFCKRADKRINNDPLKQEPKQFHDRLNHDCFDIAFEIEWMTLTPTAANPCVASDWEIKASPPGCKEKEYTGYNKRWLSIDNKLVISPFTVKSAIANGFANLMGGCYRVMPESIKEPHKPIDQGQYPYIGAYKRYRVAMDGSSKPGIIKNLAIDANGDRTITIQPVKEFYLDEDLQPSLQRGDTIYATLKQKRDFKPDILGDISKTGRDKAIELEYQGIYCHGMNERFVQTKHKHRFIQRLKDKDGKDIEIKGTIKARDFSSSDDLKQIVNMGNYRLKPDDPGTGKPWYDDLNNLTENSFVYYEHFNKKVTNIGKNFLFKALFLHEDAVPEGQQACDNPDELCPRCGLFGMTSKTEDDEKTPVGFKGRFKASALVCTERWDREEWIPSTDPYPLKNKPDVVVWKCGGKTIAHQELLPISGPPKPNKRDIDGYYNKDSGEIKGAKIYRHGHLESANNIHGVNSESPDKYSHELRNYAHVCAPNLHFKGTIGAENCTVDEIAGLLLLLHTPEGKHGFKIGLGKAFGMGSVYSTVKKIWVRERKTYKWQMMDGHWIQKMEKDYDAIWKAMNNLKKIGVKINSLNNIENRKLKKYPAPGRDYWRTL